jgi:hypothetical protein
VIKCGSEVLDVVADDGTEAAGRRDEPANPENVPKPASLWMYLFRGNSQLIAALIGKALELIA